MDARISPVIVDGVLRVPQLHPPDVDVAPEVDDEADVGGPVGPQPVGLPVVCARLRG